MTAGSGSGTVQGNGAANAGISNDGVEEFAASTITSGGGNVSVTGQAGGSSASGSAGSDQGVLIVTKHNRQRHCRVPHRRSRQRRL